MNDANKLAWKGTPGPWVPATIGTRRGTVYLSTLHSHTFRYQTVADIFGITQEEMEANMAFVSAAPEAIEFIADILDMLDKGYEYDETIVKRAEEILKKAYNF